jgi:hypothetical protein
MFVKNKPLDTLEEVGICDSWVIGILSNLKRSPTHQMLRGPAAALFATAVFCLVETARSGVEGYDSAYQLRDEVEAL